MVLAEKVQGRAFSLVELMVVVAIIALLMSLLLPALAGVRRAGRTAVCQSNMRQIALGGLTYSNDWRDVVAQFTWRAGTNKSAWWELRSSSTDLDARNNQCTDIIRRLMNDDGTIYAKQPEVSWGAGSRNMCRNLWYLALIDGGYMNEKVPSPAAVCPEDVMAKTWSRYPGRHAEALAVTGDPDPSADESAKAMLPFWCSYQSVPAAWSADIGPLAMYQSTDRPGAHNLYVTSYSWFNSRNSTKLASRRMSDVKFASQKVWMFDTFDRHYARRPLWHAYKAGRQPLAFFDGSVVSRTTADSNEGWNTSSPKSGPVEYTYWPDLRFEPAPLNGETYEYVKGHYRWTRGGLGGVDFNGGEIKNERVR